MKTLFFLLLLFFSGSFSWAQPVNLTYSSSYCNEIIPYKVWLPEAPAQLADTLDLLVVLDGDEYFGIAKNTVELYHFGEKVEQSIILSLPSTPQSRWKYFTPTKADADNDGGQNELYQYTGKFDQFSNFLSLELIPHIQKQYGVHFKKRIIFGHSMGGLGVLSFAVLRPEIFNHYIAASPSTMYDQHFIFKQIEEKVQLEYEALFLTAAGQDAAGYKENVLWLNEFLNKHNNNTNGKRVGMSIYVGENHGTSGIKSLIDGLAFLYKE